MKFSSSAKSAIFNGLLNVLNVYQFALSSQINILMNKSINVEESYQDAGTVAGRLPTTCSSQLQSRQS